ncbi:Serine/threonine-protein kinase D2 [Liparis tanakae]|uniref:Serine/threonine-protein kinase D2 n=1 Tax=Liparis tanakae TaxID=230148 RepID=A0A4Z2FXH9_9TELE|nr:Serine/threonine-protein kinase D2 [Liparis tanakae]
MSSGAMAQVFFPPGGSSPPGSAVMQQGTPISSVPSAPAPGGFPLMELIPVQGPGGVALIPAQQPPPPGVSFIIQIGLTRESVLMPQSADLAYVKQIACSIVDTKLTSLRFLVLPARTRRPPQRFKRLHR